MHETAAELKPELVAQTNKETGHFELKYDSLERIFTESATRDLKAAIISIAGPYRKGKSFLLNFFIRYFRLNRLPNWLEQDVEDALQGFHWQDGANPDTFGILLWPKPFVVDDVAVFFMDTQGSFDGTQDSQDNAIVLAFTVMVSTVTIYNLHGNLQFNYVDHLHLCTEYGRSALEKEDESPFEQLVCLIRDWQFTPSHCFGFKGGQEYLEKFLGDLGDQNKEIGDSLQSTYKMRCFLMSKQLESEQKSDFRGQIVDLSPTFVEGLSQLIPGVVIDVLEAKPKLKTCYETLEVFAEFFNALKRMPRIRNQTELQRHLDLRNAAVKAKIEYNKRIKSAVKDGSSPVCEKKLKEVHEEAFFAAINVFKNARKMKGSEDIGEYLKELEDDLQAAYGDICHWNANIHQQKIKEKISMGLAGAGIVGAVGAAVAYSPALLVPCAFACIGSVALIAAGGAAYFVLKGVDLTVLSVATMQVKEFIWPHVSPQQNDQLVRVENEHLVGNRDLGREVRPTCSRFNKSEVFFMLVIIVLMLLVCLFNMLDNVKRVVVGIIIIGVYVTWYSQDRWRKYVKF